jgi:hypothetical protein
MVLQLTRYSNGVPGRRSRVQVLSEPPLKLLSGTVAYLQLVAEKQMTSRFRTREQPQVARCFA